MVTQRGSWKVGEARASPDIPAKIFPNPQLQVTSEVLPDSQSKLRQEGGVHLRLEEPFIGHQFKHR